MQAEKQVQQLRFFAPLFSLTIRIYAHKINMVQLFYSYMLLFA